MKHLLLRCLPAISLLSVAAAQLPTTILDPNDPYGALYLDKRSQPWPANVARAGAFTGAVAARLTGHHVPDLVLLSGSEPLLVAAPDVHAASISVLPGFSAQRPIQDLATLTGGGTAGDDAIVTVGVSGLDLCRRSSSGFERLAIGSPAWNAATLVATHPGRSDLVFGATTSNSILLATRTGSSWTTTSFQPAPVVATGAIVALVALHTDVDTNPEIATLSVNGVAIYRAGSPVPLREVGHTTSNRPYPSAARAIARVRYGFAPVGGHQPEALAWLAPKAAPAGCQLTVLGSGDERAWDLGTEPFTAISAGDWSLDGQDDVFLTHGNKLETVLLINGYSQVTSLFVPAFGFRVRTGSDSHGSELTPVVSADFDGDGDGDFVCPAVNGAGIAVELAFITSRPHFDDADRYLLQGETDVDNHSPGSPWVIEFLDQTYPTPTIGITHQLGWSPNAMEILLWPIDAAEQEEDDVMLPVPTRREYIDLPVGDQLNFELTLSAAEWDVGMHGFLLRPVHVENGITVRAGHGMTGILYTSQALANRDGTDGGIKIPAVPPKPLPPTPPGTPPAGGV